MTEEEKKAIEYFKNLDMDLNTLMRISLNELDLVKKIILNLIEKQAKENEQLRTELNSRNKEIEELKGKNKTLSNFTSCIFNEKIEKEWIRKDKIKDKIENMNNVDWDTDMLVMQGFVKDYAIKILQELLEGDEQ